MTTTDPPKGELFSRLYIERGAPTQDSAFFRNRLSGYLEAEHYKDYWDIAKVLKQEGGLIVVATWIEKTQVTYYDFPRFFHETQIQYILSAVTLIWRYLRQKYAEFPRDANPFDPSKRVFPKASAWREFIARAFREENLSYSVDELCGVHYLIDEEFERNRVSALRAADAPRYSAVRSAFESAHTYLDAQPPDTKASVRSMFEAMEILARLMDPASNNLNKWQVENKLKPLALSRATDAVERESLGKLMQGIGDWVDALHVYRHGQGVQAPVVPSLELAVYVLSSGAAALRMLLGVDARIQGPAPMS